MILKYNDYLSEKVINNLLLESRLVFSKEFYNIISRIKGNNIADKLIKLDNVDVDGVKQNYIDITDEKDKVSFTPDKKAQDLNKDIPEIWKVTNSSRYLTHSDKNNKVFEALGYDKTLNENWAPSVETLGVILAETTRPSGNTYVLFEEYDNVDTKRLSVINKLALELSHADNIKIWKTSRNPMNIGRLVRSILKSAKVSFNENELEEFVNQYKAVFDFTKDRLRQFDVVSGKDIAYWYNGDRYQRGGGSLNNSCMSGVDSDLFDIYCYNNQVSLIILYDDNGNIDDYEYKSNNIKGRAILWDCQIDGTKSKFMDRIYTTLDSDVILFKQFAEKNGWWYKKIQNMDPDEEITDGKTSKKATIVASVNETNWDKYPYLDTLCFVSTSGDFLTNKEDFNDVDRLARDTGGEYSTI
jgi:Asp-tRNA(Asn)/Glu-tRNA(Gln) amidotransferase C subunit